LQNVSATAARSEADWSLGGGVSLSERLLSEAIQTGYFEVVPRIADRQCIVVRKASVAKNKRKYYCSRTDDKGECIRCVLSLFFHSTFTVAYRYSVSGNKAY
jgi:hypothetical protein